MSTTRQYEKVNGGSNNRKWEPHKQVGVVYNDQNPAVLEGYLARVNPISHNGKVFNVHEIHTLDEKGNLAEVFDVTLGVGLENTLKNIDLETWIRLEYKGKKPAKIAGQMFNDVAVSRHTSAIPYSQMTGVATKSPAPQNTGSTNSVSNSNPFPEDDDSLPF
jgi:hypothetical protein